MEHAGLFRVIVLVYLMVCSIVGLLKIVAYEICQTESITMLKLGHGHGGDGDGIGKIKIKLRELCEVCRCLFSGVKDELYRVNLTKL